MLTVPSLASSPTTLTLPPSVLAVTTSDIVSTRTTPVAAPAPLSNQPAADNAQSNGAIPAAVAAENSAAVAANAGGASGTLANNLSTSGPSSSFLAQLLSQTNDDENSVAATYAHFAPAPEYNTFVGYSFIKYKPSDAGLPPQRSPLPSPVTTYTTPPEQPVVPAPAQADQNSVAASVPAPVVAQNNEDTATEQAPAPVATVTPPPVANIPAQNNAPLPGVSTNDFQAYSQTQSRNQSNLSLAQPQLIVAG